MRLYHYTCHLWWRYIRVDGISRGEAPVALRRAFNWPNPTEKSDPSAQGWTGSTMANKRAVRITVDIPECDERLIDWRAYTDDHGMPRQLYRGYDRAGGWQARHWWIYRGVITPDRFVAVDLLGEPTVAERKWLQSAEEATGYADFCHRIGLAGPLYTSSHGESFVF